ncbi:MAG: hypothetical protein ABSG96_07760 [Terracidiphilus sp.]
MEQHLNADQIDKLLRPARGVQTGSDSDRGPLEEAYSHLRSCKSCEEQILERKKAMELLALLKFDAPVSPGALCPPGDVWMEVAAGIASSASDKYLRHASECDHCGGLLNQAAEDFIEELTPGEEAQIANLTSSTSDWQTRLATRLSGTHAFTPNIFAARRSWLSSFVGPMPSSRLALAAALAGLVVLGIRDYSLEAHLSSQSLRAAADVQRLEQDVLKQKTQIADLNAQVSSPTPASAHSAQQVTGNASIATLVLDAGLTRGAGEMKRLSVPAGTELVRITLHVPGAPDGVMREELLNFDRRRIWSQELKASAAETKSGSVTLLVPSYLLTPDDYLIKLSRETPDKSEEVATYSFRVPR